LALNLREVDRALAVTLASRDELAAWQARTAPYHRAPWELFMDQSKIDRPKTETVLAATKEVLSKDVKA